MEPAVANLERLKRLSVSLAPDNEALGVVASSLAWLTRCLNVLALAVFDVVLWSQSASNPHHGGPYNFFPPKTSLEHAKDISLTIIPDGEQNVPALELACEEITSALFQRFASVTTIELGLPHFYGLFSTIRHCPLLQSFTVVCCKRLEREDLDGFMAWLRRGEHESTSLLLRTYQNPDFSSDLSKDMIIRVEDWLGGTFLTWYDRAEDRTIAESESSGDEGSADEVSADETYEQGEQSANTNTASDNNAKEACDERHAANRYRSLSSDCY